MSSKVGENSTEQPELWIRRRRRRELMDLMHALQIVRQGEVVQEDDRQKDDNKEEDIEGKVKKKQDDDGNADGYAKDVKEEGRDENSQLPVEKKRRKKDGLVAENDDIPLEAQALFHIPIPGHFFS